MVKYMSEANYSQKSKWPKIALISILLIAGLFGLLKKMSTKSADLSKNELVIYCAAGIKLPIADVTKAYSEEYGIPVKIEYGSSGELESKLLQDASYNKERAHLYIPADVSFSQRTIEKGLTFASLPMAGFHLVLAVKPGDDIQIESVKDLLSKEINFAICNEKAGAGKKTMGFLKKANLWDEVSTKRKVVCTKVTECANLVKSSDSIRAGFVWNTTAKQFGLRIIELPELKGASTSINVNLTKNSNPRGSLHLARYLSSPEKGSKAFTKHGFNVRSGDKWTDRPELVLFCGGINKKAVDKTISEFEEREGVTINTQYDGCGTLVTSIAAQKSQHTFPDAFLTCDKSYFEKVSADFLPGEDISSTEIIMLVRKSNPKNIKKIEDLTAPGLKVGTTDKRKSTLGHLSWKIFRAKGVEEKMAENVVVTAPTAHKLITQFMAHGKLDAVLVYNANCSQVLDEYELIPIDHDLSTAIQNIGISKNSPYPLLMSRLVMAIKSLKSKNRYSKNGFKWVVHE